MEHSKSNKNESNYTDTNTDNNHCGDGGNTIDGNISTVFLQEFHRPHHDLLLKLQPSCPAHLLKRFYKVLLLEDDEASKALCPGPSNPNLQKTALAPHELLLSSCLCVKEQLAQVLPDHPTRK